MLKIAPSILSANLSDIKNEVKLVDKAGAEMIHVDIMDGHYVNNITFGPNIVRAIRPFTKKKIDVHLMISPVSYFVNDFINAGADIISFHPEADPHPIKTLEKIKNLNCKCGIAIHPKFDVFKFKKYFSIVDNVIIMTVVPGFSGQKFLKKQLKQIKLLNNYRIEKKFKFEIEVDGGINNQNSILCKNNGANIIVAGSYIYNQSQNKYKKLINSLR